MSRLLFLLAFAVSRPWYWLMRQAGRLDGDSVDQPVSFYAPEDVQHWLDLWAQVRYGRPGGVLTVRPIADPSPQPPPPPPAP